MQKDDEIRLRHMLDAAREAVGFAHNRSIDDLYIDRMLTLSLVKDIEIVGESAYQVSETTRAGLPDIPWMDIISMRNRLVHVYFDINLEILWQTIQQDIPTLISHLDKILSGEI